MRSLINELKPVRIFELVLRPCSLVYGVGDCSASLGVTGDHKCYNTPRTCQVPADYQGDGTQILRFCEPSEDLALTFDAIPCLTDISRRPQQVDPGESVGVRESGTASMHNFKYNDALTDPYLSGRSFNPYNQGTFWGKFIARWGNLQGIECRTVDGFVGQDISEMERRYYVVESQSGPDSSGKTSFTFKDIIKFLDGDKAQAPAPSLGSLLLGIDTSETSLTLTPTGIGATYPASGYASMGDEAVSYGRSGDLITLTGRALFGSQLDDHDAGETFQIGLYYSSDTPAELINDWIENYTDTPAEYLDFANWQNECQTYIARLYSGFIMTPTPVKTLCNEIIQEAGLIFNTDLVNKKISIKALRQFAPVATLSDDNYLAGTITSTPSTDKRVSEVWVYYGKRNPLEKQDQKKNYRSIYVKPTSNSIVALENGPSAIREITSRWITVFNQQAAVSVAQSIISRYEIAPRSIGFKLHPGIVLGEGQAISVSSRIFEDDQGFGANEIQCQILQIVREPESISVLAEEVRFSQIPVGPERIININEDSYNINIRTVHDSIYTPAESGDFVRLIVANGVKIGSVYAGSYSLDTGDWPTGVTVTIEGNLRIQGAGGDGVYGPSATAKDGGPALRVRYPTEIIGNVQIWGGGGGGGGSSFPNPSVPQMSGGGAGFIPGIPGATTEAGATGFPWAGGGNPGMPGQNGSTPGGAAGIAINGLSNLTITGTANIKGPQIG